MDVNWSIVLKQVEDASPIKAVLSKGDIIYVACGAKIHRIDVKQIQKTNQYPINDLSKSFGIYDDVTLITIKDFLVVGVSSKVFFIALDRQRFSNEATEVNLGNSRKKVSLVYDYSYSKCIYAGCSGYIYIGYPL